MKPLAFVISPGLGQTAALMILSGILVARRMKDPRVCVLFQFLCSSIYDVFLLIHGSRISI